MGEKDKQTAGQDGPLVLALDAGTSSVRAMLFDRQGHAVKDCTGQKHYRMNLTPDGGAEADAAELVEHMAAAIDDALEQAGPLAKRIAGVGVSCFWHSLLAVDGAGRALTPVYSWADGRSADAADQLRVEVDEGAVHDRTGCVIHASYWPAKLRWLQGTQAQVVKRAARWCGFGEYLLGRFTGGDGCSVAMASGTGLLNQHTADWDQPMLDLLGLRPDHLPPLVDRDEALPRLTDEWAGRWPALAEAAWYPAVGDGVYNNVGSGCVTPTRLALSIGTSGVMRVVIATKDVEIPPKLWCYRLDRRRFVLGGALSNGGVVADWLHTTLRLPDDAAEQVAAQRPDSHGLTVLPYLAGQRTPDWNPRSRASILGLTLDTTPVAIARAGLEAVAYRFALVHELLRPLAADGYQIIVSGGAIAHWPVWPQIIADAIGRPLVASAEPEASARGAALLALDALDLIPGLEDTPAPLGETYTPDERNYPIYQRARARLEHFHDLLQPELSGATPPKTEHLAAKN
ncbi:MAG: gluconokinase [Thermomicrobiales bacterium]